MVLSWELDFEVALRVLRRRWWEEVADLLDRSSAEVVAFDELELDEDLEELGNAVSSAKLVRFAERCLGAQGPEPEDDPALRVLEAPPAKARAFLRLLGANLAFALRTDTLLAALVASLSGPAPRLEPAVVGGLLARARSARWTREALGSLPSDRREAALQGIVPGARAGDFSVAHARSTPEALGEAIGRVLASKGDLVPVDWGVRKSREEDSAQERWLVSLPRNGWCTVIARGGVSRDFAQALSGRSPALGRVVWAERAGERPRFAVFESSRLQDDEEKLLERVPDLSPDDVAGALRTLGIVAHDPLSSAATQSLVFADYVAEGRSSSPARLRRQGVVGFAFSPRGGRKPAADAPPWLLAAKKVGGKAVGGKKGKKGQQGKTGQKGASGKKPRS